MQSLKNTALSTEPPALGELVDWSLRMSHKKAWLIVVLTLLIGASPLIKAETPHFGSESPRIHAIDARGTPIEPL